MNKIMYFTYNQYDTCGEFIMLIDKLNIIDLNTDQCQQDINELEDWVRERLTKGNRV